MKKLLLLFALGLWGCRQSPPPAPPPPTFTSDSVSEICPLNNGAAYVRMSSLGLHYVLNGEAEPVKKEDGTPFECQYDEIKAAGALAYCEGAGSDGGLYLLKGAVAVKVKLKPSR